MSKQAKKPAAQAQPTPTKLNQQKEREAQPTPAQLKQQKEREAQPASKQLKQQKEREAQPASKQLKRQKNREAQSVSAQLKQQKKDERRAKRKALVKSKTFKVVAALCAVLFLGGTAVAIHFALAADVPNPQDDTRATESAVAVKVAEITPSSEDVVLKYVGSMQPKTTDSVAYNQISTVTAVYVTEGQNVKKGDIVAKVDTKNAQSEVDIAYYELQVANAAVSRTQLAYDYAVSELDAAAIRAQEDPPAIGDEPLEYYQYQVDTAKTALDQAVSQQKSARATYNSAKSLLADCTIRATMDGYVVAIITEAGNLATPLNPIVVIGSYESVAVFGVSATDVHDLELSLPCTISLADTDYSGEITYISRLPDSTSRTYETKVSVPIEGETFLIGEIVSVGISIGRRDGVWIPISVILNDGRDYVFLVEDGHAVKTYISLGAISNDMVQVEGLENGGLLVTDGMKTLKTGNLVNIVN